MERLTPELFIQTPLEIQRYHLNKALIKLRRRQVTLMHVLVSRYCEVVQQDGLTDIFHMNTCIRAFTYGVLHGISNTQHPYLQQPVNVIRLQRILMDCIDCLEQLLKHPKPETVVMHMFYFLQQYGKSQKNLKERFSITWISISN